MFTRQSRTGGRHASSQRLFRLLFQFEPEVPFRYQDKIERSCAKG